MENKELICEKLLTVLQATDNLSDLVSLHYNKETEVVKATFANGATKFANVAMDSGTSMIRDIIKQII